MAGEKWGDFMKGLFGKNKGDKKGGLIPALLLLGTAGIAIMLLSTVFQPGSPPAARSPAGDSQPTLGSSKKGNSMDDYETKIEKELQDILANISGVGQVSVMVNIDSSEELVVGNNHSQSTNTTKESDGKGTTRENGTQSTQDSNVILKNGSNDEPLILKTIAPKIRGVVIVASGATNLQVKAWILEAVERVLGIPSYKISIVPKK